MSLPGLGEAKCVERSVTRVKTLSITDFVITESPYAGRKDTVIDTNGPVDVFEGETVMPRIAATGIERDTSKKVASGTWVQPICYAARIEGGGLSNVVEAGATVFLSGDGRDWQPFPYPDAAAHLKCTGGKIVNTSVARDREKPTETPCSKAPTEKELAEKDKTLQRAPSGAKLYFEAGVHGTEASTNPFTQARTPAITFHCGGCLAICTPGTCGGPDGCGGTCGCANGQTCKNGSCGPCEPQCQPGRCGSDGCGGTCQCTTGHGCKGGRCVACGCATNSCGQDACGNPCTCKDGDKICRNGRCVDESTACQAPARWCECTQSCLNTTFCRKREDEGGCVSGARFRVPIIIR